MKIRELVQLVRESGRNGLKKDVVVEINGTYKNIIGIRRNGNDVELVLESDIKKTTPVKKDLPQPPTPKPAPKSPHLPEKKDPFASFRNEEG